MSYRRRASPLHSARAGAGCAYCLALAVAALMVSNPLALGANYVPSSGAVFGSSTATGTAASTMVASGSDITVTLGAVSSGGVQAAPVTSGTLTWTPDTAATDLAGNPLAATPFTTSGPAF